VTGVYRTVDVARILGVPAARVRAIVRAGLCQPLRQGRSFQFSFRDLVLMRAAHGLLQAAVPPRRIRTALRELVRQLPPGRPVTGVRIYADGRCVVARSGHRAWHPESGQAVFTFDMRSPGRSAPAHVPAPRPHRRAEAVYWFTRALTLESEDTTAAEDAYRRAIELDPEMGDAYLNLGRLVHEGGDTQEAVHLYQEALNRGPDDAVAHYNLATALEDQGDTVGAVHHYHQSIDLDAELADAHYNLGRLLERLGQRTQALRYLLAYKKLTDNEAG